jgi:hypothetical protein
VLIEKLLVFLDISENVTERKNEYSPEYHLVAVRGFTMLLMMQEMEICNFYGVFERMIDLFAKSTHALREQPDETYQNFPAEFVAKCLSKEELGTVVQRFQLYITIVIMEKIFKQDIMQAVIEVMDVFYQANQLKPRAERLPDAEFYNDALNNDVDLSK